MSSNSLKSTAAAPKSDEMLNTSPSTELHVAPNMTEKNSGNDQEEDKKYITGFKLYSVLLGVTLVGLLFMLDQTILATAIPQISEQFNSTKDIGWYGSAYLLTTAAMQPLTGKIYQYYSCKIVFLVSLSLFELGSLICGVAQTSKTLIVGRAIAGLGGAGLFTGLLTIIAACAPPAKRPVYLGGAMGVASIGLAIGPVLGGVFTEYASWRWCFFLNLPLGGITAVVLLLISIPNSHIQTSTKATISEQLNRLDLPGFASFTPSIVMFLLAMQWGGTTYAWSSATIIGLFCGSAGGFVIFGLLERRAGGAAMLPLAIMRKRKVICAAIMSLLSQGGGLLIAYYLPVWFQVVQGTTPTIGGVHLLPSIGGIVFGAVVSGALVTRTGYFAPFAILGCAFSAIGSGLLVTLNPNSSTAKWVCYQAVACLGRGFTMQQGVTAVQAALPPVMLPIGSAYVTLVQLLGGTLFISFGQTVLTNQLKLALAHFAPTVDPERILAVGATAFGTVVTPGQVPGVVLAYNQALTTIFYLGVGAGCVSFVVSFGLGWTNIKTLKDGKSTLEKTGEDQV